MEQLISISVFVAFGFSFVFLNLTVGKLVRPDMPNEEKLAVYECGEPTIGSSWVQFDLRFYIVALFYLVFDVEVALIYPWAVIFREHTAEALVVGLPFILIVVVGYAYEWYAGSLDWVRSSVNTSYAATRHGGADLSELARRDPEALEDQAGAIVAKA